MARDGGGSGLYDVLNSRRGVAGCGCGWGWGWGGWGDGGVKGFLKYT